MGAGRGGLVRVYPGSPELCQGWGTLPYPSSNSSPHSYAVFARGCAECPRLTCGREGCGTEFCYHCRQPWHPDGPCVPVPSLGTPTAQLAQPEELAHGEALAQGGSGRAGVWHSCVPAFLLPVGLLEPGARVPSDCLCCSLIAPVPIWLGVEASWLPPWYLWDGRSLGRLGEDGLDAHYSVLLSHPILSPTS